MPKKTSFECVQAANEARYRSLAARINTSISHHLDKIQYNEAYECNEAGEGYSKMYLGDYNVNDLFGAERFIQKDPRINRYEFDKGSPFGTYEVWYSDPERWPWPELSPDVVERFQRRKIRNRRILVTVLVVFSWPVIWTCLSALSKF